MSEVVVISPDRLREIVRDAVESGVGSAIATLSKKTPKEMNDNEAAEYLGVSPITLRAWRSQKRGPAYHKSGRAVRYSKVHLDQWLAGNKVLTIDSLGDHHEKSC